MSNDSNSPATYGSTLADHVLTLRHDQVPAAIREHAVRLITDTIADGLYGAGSEPGRAIHAEAVNRYREAGAQIWGRPESLDAAGAAMVNAAQSHAFEVDDYLPAAKSHPGTVIIPAALAVASETGTTGRELVTSVVAAYDVMCRVAFAINPNSARGRGFHMTGLTGPFGAAAVAGRLMGLDRDQLTSAFGSAASASAGIFAFSAEGAMTKPFHAGRAAEAGIVAARLALNGFQGPTAALEAEDGGLLAAVSNEPRPEMLTEELGSRFDLGRVAIKPYPCCGSIHSSIDAVFDIVERSGITPDQVELVEVHNASGVILQCGFEYSSTGGPLEAQMSLQYCLAAALVDGQVGLRQFDEDRRRDPAICDLAARTTFVLDPELDRIYPERFPALVKIRTEAGSVLESRIENPLGTPENALDDKGLRAKFDSLTSGTLSSEKRDSLFAAARSIDSDDRAVGLTAILRHSRTSAVRDGLLKE